MDLRQIHVESVMFHVYQANLRSYDHINQHLPQISRCVLPQEYS